MTRDATLGEALRLLAHDLKNPLSAVQTNVAYARDFLGSLPAGAASPDVDEALLDARLACEAMQRFLGNLELLAGELSPSPRREEDAPTDLGSLAEEAVFRQRSEAEARRLRLTLTRGEPMVARCDPGLLLRALDNLVANAVQHAPLGGTVEVALDRDGADVTIDVIDQGPCVPAPLRDAAAELDGQIRLKRQESARYGRGLGLFAAGAAARACRARLEVGELDGRCRLRLRIPRGDGEW